MGGVFNARYSRYVFWQDSGLGGWAWGPIRGLGSSRSSRVRSSHIGFVWMQEPAPEKIKGVVRSRRAAFSGVSWPHRPLEASRRSPTGPLVVLTTGVKGVSQQLGFSDLDGCHHLEHWSSKHATKQRLKNSHEAASSLRSSCEAGFLDDLRPTWVGLRAGLPLSGQVHLLERLVPRSAAPSAGGGRLGFGVACARLVLLRRWAFVVALWTFLVMLDANKLPAHLERPAPVV